MIPNAISVLKEHCDYNELFKEEIISTKRFMSHFSAYTEVLYLRKKKEFEQSSVITL